MEPFLISAGLVALAEIGDKTQLLALVLATRFGKPLPIILGILVATLANHALAGAIGSWLDALLPAETLRWVVGLTFLGIAIWTLMPDHLDEDEGQIAHYGVFVTTLIAFFVAEMGDKTQIATAALAAQHNTFIPVVVGTTLGMMIANVPAVLVGNRLANQIPVRLVHRVAAVIFALLGVATLFGAGERFRL